MKNNTYLHGFFKTGDYRSEYALTEEQCVDIVQKIIDWCAEHGGTLGEVIMQDDDCIISAPELLADIVDDIIKFNIIDEEE